MKLFMSAAVAAAGLALPLTAPADSTPPIKFHADILGAGQVHLGWQNYVPDSADTATINVLRDGVIVQYVQNPQPLTGENENTATITGQPTGAHTYQVCERILFTALGPTDDPPALCSNVVTRTVT